MLLMFLLSDNVVCMCVVPDAKSDGWGVVCVGEGCQCELQNGT